MPNLVPFDRQFFEAILPQAIGSFSQQIGCDQPLVQVLTVDGAQHFVKGVAGVSDAWVALHTQVEDTEQAVEMFVPYQTIFRVSIVPCEEHNRRLGFILSSRPTPTVSVPAVVPETPAKGERKAGRRGAAKK
jgi:hypothetical protein